MKQLVLITGARGFIGSALKLHLQKFGLNVVGMDLVSGEQKNFVACDVSDSEALAHTLAALRPTIIIHCAAMKGLPTCEADKPKSFATNVLSTEVIVEYAKQHDAKLIYISSDVVFDGKRGNYAPDDKPQPINWYGKTKAFSELLVSGVPRSTICRTALVIGQLDVQYKQLLDAELKGDLLVNQTLFPQYVHEQLRQGKPVHLSERIISNPTPIELLCWAIDTVITGDVSGVLHTSGPDSMSRFELGCIIADHVGADRSLLIADEGATSTLRPQNISLDTVTSFERLRIDPAAWHITDYLARKELYA